MTDLRKRVEDDRGLLKKMQMHIPGYAGYRRREDLRIADSLLREQVTKRMDVVQDRAERVRQTLADDLELDKLNDLKGVIHDIHTYKGKIAHATQEYSGISADIRIEEEALNRLYTYDLALFDNIARLELMMGHLEDRSGGEKFEDTVKTFRKIIGSMTHDFNMRTETIAGLVVTR